MSVFRYFARLRDGHVDFKTSLFSQRPRSKELLQRIKRIHGVSKHPYYNDFLVGELDGEMFAIYETVSLKLMTSGKRYNSIWDPETADADRSVYTNNAARKRASYVLELSYPLKDAAAPFTLESIMYTVNKKVREGRFLLVHSQNEKQICHTTTSENKPLIRQTSDHVSKSQLFRCECRETHSSTIDLIFIVFPHTLDLAIPDVINTKDYEALLELDNIMIFKQEAPISF